jgi:hypothetical protein
MRLKVGDGTTLLRGLARGEINRDVDVEPMESLERLRVNNRFKKRVILWPRLVAMIVLNR